MGDKSFKVLERPIPSKIQKDSEETPCLHIWGGGETKIGGE